MNEILNNLILILRILTAVPLVMFLYKQSKFRNGTEVGKMRKVVMNFIGAILLLDFWLIYARVILINGGNVLDLVHTILSLVVAIIVFQSVVFAYWEIRKIKQSEEKI